ncbi:MAG: signal peptidase I [Clostridia bacterium]|nr:signal peptidase I [Clostridia bacterium]
MEWVKDIVIAIIIAVLVMQFIKPTIVKESSMEPTLYANNYLFLSKQSYTFSEPERGDIVVFHTSLTTADGKEKLLIKRVIGLPGDEISISEGQVYINGEAINEPYIKDGFTPGYVEPLVVPEDSLFVMGDNRVVSIDSRSETVGCIKISAIVGKAFLRLYPFDQICTF